MKSPLGGHLPLQLAVCGWAQILAQSWGGFVSPRVLGDAGSWACFSGEGREVLQRFQPVI